MHRLLTLRLAAWRSRRLLRALLLAVVVGLAVHLAAPPPPATPPVVVVARPVPAGGVLTADDLRVVRLASGAVPIPSARTADSAVGRRAAIDLPTGLVLVPSLLSGERFAVDPPAGSVVVPVTLGGSSSLRVGDTVEVVADQGCPSGDEPLAVTALVVGLGPAAGSGGADPTNAGGVAAGLGIGSTAALSLIDDASTLIAVAPQSGRKIAGIVQNCRISAVIVP
jgi:hypothetical protein